MRRFIAGEDRQQITLLPDCLDGSITADNPVRLAEVFVDELDLAALGFAGAVPEATGRPAYHPATLLKIYLYGSLDRIPSSRRLERESQRNIALISLAGRLRPDFKTLNGVAGFHLPIQSRVPDITDLNYEFFPQRPREVTIA